MRKHLITRIVRDSILDGPGCRYVVFVKGCHLRCGWCHNPETQNLPQEIMYYETFCIHCSRCREANPDKPGEDFSPEKLRAQSDPRYFPCVDACPTGALEYVAREYTTEWLMEDMLKYEIVYRQTGGGLTISGGEPLITQEFSYELLTKAKEHQFHTALDTSGTHDWQILERFLDVVDLWLLDMKHIDDDSLLTKKNISNLANLAVHNASIWMRIPVIPGYNDSEDVLAGMAKIIAEKKSNIADVFLLPYHPFGDAKYIALGREYTYPKQPMDEGLIEKAATIFLRYLPREMVHIGTRTIQG